MVREKRNTIKYSIGATIQLSNVHLIVNNSISVEELTKRIEKYIQNSLDVYLDLKFDENIAGVLGDETQHDHVFNVVDVSVDADDFIGNEDGDDDECEEID